MDQWEEMLAAARSVDRLYQEKDRERIGRPWNLAELFAQCAPDWGELAEQVGKFDGYRPGDYEQAKAEHELGDLQWALIVIADRLGIDLHQALIATMAELDAQLGGKD